MARAVVMLTEELCDRGKMDVDLRHIANSLMLLPVWVFLWGHRGSCGNWHMRDEGK